MLFKSILVSLLATATHAFPAAEVEEVSHSLVARQSVISKELEIGPCRRITFIYARGSTEPTNMGITVGPDMCAALKARFGSDQFACQGVGLPYLASLSANTLPRGTSPAAIGEATRLFRLANSKCPNTIVTAGGYSQGAAVIAAALSDLSQQAPAVANQVRGTVLFGYTKNQQNGGRIPSYPVERTRVFCAPGDLVCEGTLIVIAPHFTYQRDVPEAVNFLASRVGQ